jgi:hypothetical protein
MAYLNAISLVNVSDFVLPIDANSCSSGFEGIAMHLAKGTHM